MHFYGDSRRFPCNEEFRLRDYFNFSLIRQIALNCRQSIHLVASAHLLSCAMLFFALIVCDRKSDHQGSYMQLCRLNLHKTNWSIPLHRIA